jgi:hypothetical protein
MICDGSEGWRSILVRRCDRVEASNESLGITTASLFKLQNEALSKFIWQQIDLSAC